MNLKVRCKLMRSFDRDKLFVWLEANIVEIKRRINEANSNI